MQTGLRRFWLAAALIMLLAQPMRAGEKLRVATCDDYPPLSDVNAEGELVGFDVDIARALCHALDVACELVVVPWEGILDGLAAGKYDAVIASMGITPEREQIVSFTDMYYRSNSTFVGKAGWQTPISPEGLPGKSLAAVRDTLQAEYLQQHYGSVATLKLAETTAQAFDLLVKGEVELVLESDLTIFQFLNSDAGREFDFVSGPVPGGPSGAAYIAVRKDDVKLRADLNQAIQAIRLDGVYGKINRKYFPFSVY